MSERQHVVVMGVSGCGKTTVAEGLAKALGWPLDEGDDYHPQANVDKMKKHIPLEDADRWPWLQILADRISARDRDGISSILSCSSLKRSYRDLLRTGAPHVRFVHLYGEQSVLAARLASRKGHFFPPDLLASQYSALEQLQQDEVGFVVDIELNTATQISESLRRLGLCPPDA